MNKEQQKKPMWYSDSKDPSKENKFTFCLSLISGLATTASPAFPGQRQCTGCDTAPYLVLPPAPRPHVPRTPAVLREEKSQPSAAQTTILSPANSVRTCTGSLLGHGVQGLCGAAPPAPGPQPPAAGPEPAGLHLHGPACSALPP